MLRKALVIYLASFIAAVVISGCCNCDHVQVFNMRWKGLSLSSKPYNIVSGMVSPAQDTTSGFYGKNYLLQVLMQAELVARNHIPVPGFINQAYACKCNEDSYHAKQSITSFHVFSVYAYDAKHDAMSDITEYFRSQDYSKTAVDGLGPLNLGLSQEHFYGLERNFDLYLQDKPSLGKMHQFKVVVGMSDGSELTALTSLLRF